MDSYCRIKIYERVVENMVIGENNCHLWTGNIDDNGYGTTHLFGRIWKVHRLTTLFFRDLKLDAKINVRHKCKNRHCFNPDHLIVKIKQDNS